MLTGDVRRCPQSGERALQLLPSQAQFAMMPCGLTVNRVLQVSGMLYTGVCLWTYVVDVPEYVPEAYPPYEPYAEAEPE